MQVDLSPREYRRKGKRRSGVFPYLIVAVPPLGVLAAIVIAYGNYFVPSALPWHVLAVAFAPILILLIAAVILDRG